MIENAAAKFGPGFKDDLPVLSIECTAGHSPDGEMLAAVMRFENAPEFRFAAPHQIATAFLTSLACAQTSALKCRIARADGTPAPEMPAVWSIASRIGFAPSPEGQVMMILDGESTADRAGVRLTLQQVREMHAALGLILAHAKPAPEVKTRH
jgi:hypothetical protein